VGISIRTLQRWRCGDEILEDLRPDAKRPEPISKLKEWEHELIIAVCNEPEYAKLPPSQIVPMLADKGIYIASESSFYRVLKAKNQLHHRGRAKPKGSIAKPTPHVATKPNELWSWDITYCPSRIIGQFYYLYMIVDVFSRMIVGWEVHENETGEKAADLLERTVWREKCTNNHVVLHSDNGSPMKSLTMQAKMRDLGIEGSRGRPGVSNDNPYSESLFRTLKYSPRWPSEGFESLEDARVWVDTFVTWYNEEHRHSQIKFVTPQQRHLGLDIDILEKRKALYEEQKNKQPSRWHQSTRDWARKDTVDLNPEKGKKVG
jgi:transposase InsO family protein